MVSNTDVRALSNEWKALSNEKGELLYNKKAKRLENMAYRNPFTKFFKLIWYKLRGYSRNSNLLYRGMDSLLDRSISQISSKQKSENTHRKEMLDTMRKVSRVTLPSMIEKHRQKGHTANQLAAERLQTKLEKMLQNTSIDPQELEIAESQSEMVEEEDEKPQADKTGTESAVSCTAPPKAREEATPEPAASPIPISSPGSPSVTPPSGAPTPPTPPDPAQMKKLQMDSVAKEIETQKKLVEYLKLQNLKADKNYKQYVSTKSNLQVYQGKSAEHETTLQKVNMKTLQQAISNIEAQLKAKPHGKITIRQAGQPVQFEAEAAREALENWKELRHEILETRKKLKQSALTLQNACKKKIKKDGFQLTCEELDRRIAKIHAAIPSEVEGNNGLEFHECRLFQLENKLRSLQGKPTIKKAGQKTPAKQAAPIKQAGKQMQGALGFAAAQIAAKKAQAKPDLLKLG